MPLTTLGREIRHIGTSAPSVCGEPHQLGRWDRRRREAGHQPQGRGGIGGAAAKTGGDRQVFLEGDGEAVPDGAGPAAAEGGDGARHQIAFAGTEAGRKRVQ